MGKGSTKKSIERIRKWIDAQPVFFVATAPLDPQGHINCSPKDGYSIRVLDSTTLVYLDLIGSGVETIAHIRENARIIVMMCAFERAPLIMRFHGRGEIVEKDHADFEPLISYSILKLGSAHLSKSISIEFQIRAVLAFPLWNSSTIGNNCAPSMNEMARKNSPTIRDSTTRNPLTDFQAFGPDNCCPEPWLSLCDSRSRHKTIPLPFKNLWLPKTSAWTLTCLDPGTLTTPAYPASAALMKQGRILKTRYCI